MQKHKLESKRVLDYLNEKLKGVNKLSDVVVTFLNSNTGSFYTFLPKGLEIEKIHDFNFGGKTKSLRDEVGAFIHKLLQSDQTLACIFDDFNADFSDRENNDLYESHGLCCDNEIYYFFKNGSLFEINKCLRYSDAIWYSLCVITRSDVKEKKLDEDTIEMICKNAVCVLVGAYDAESYVMWERD